MSGVEILTVDAGDDGLRLDRWFKRHFPDLSHGHLQKLLRTGQVRLDGRRVKASDRLATGQEIRIPPLPVADVATTAGTAHARRAGERARHAAIAEDLADRVLFKNDAVLVIDKPAGLAVQGGSKTDRHVDGALDGLRLGAPERPRLVHRLDKDTSGVLVLARSVGAARWLTTEFRRRATHKLYWALVAGVPAVEQGRIDMALDKLPGGRGEKMAASDDGKPARTFYRVVDRAGRKAAWLAMEPLTGRTHQLRVHAAIGLETPIVGDGKYGPGAAIPDGWPEPRRLQLHARAIQLAMPSGPPILVQAPLPGHMKANFDFLGFDPADPEAGFLEVE